MKQSAERVNCSYITYLHTSITHSDRQHEKASLPTACPAQRPEAPSRVNRAVKWLLAGLALTGGGQLATWGQPEKRCGHHGPARVGHGPDGQRGHES